MEIEGKRGRELCLQCPGGGHVCLQLQFPKVSLLQRLGIGAPASVRAICREGFRTTPAAAVQDDRGVSCQRPGERAGSRVSSLRKLGASADSSPDAGEGWGAGRGGCQGTAAPLGSHTSPHPARPRGGVKGGSPAPSHSRTQCTFTGESRHGIGGVQSRPKETLVGSVSCRRRGSGDSSLGEGGQQASSSFTWDW